MNQIDIMIIGTQKSGTSAINQYLASHPEFKTHQTLEFTYFVNDEEYARGFDEIFAEHFRTGDYKKIIAKSVGIIYLPEALSRLYAHNAASKIIITLRNPVDRAYSAFWYAKKMGWEKAKTFEEGLENEGNHVHWIGNRFCEYLKRGEYITHIKNVLRYYSTDQIAFVLAEDLRSKTEQTCNAIMKQFGYSEDIRLVAIEKHNRSARPRFATINMMLTDANPIKQHLRELMPIALARKIKSSIRKWNEVSYDPPSMNPQTRQKLIEHFKPFNEELSILINRNLTHWNK